MLLKQFNQSRPSLASRITFKQISKLLRFLFSFRCLQSRMQSKLMALDWTKRSKHTMKLDHQNRQTIILILKPASHIFSILLVYSTITLENKSLVYVIGSALNSIHMEDNLKEPFETTRLSCRITRYLNTSKQIGPLAANHELKGSITIDILPDLTTQQKPKVKSRRSSPASNFTIMLNHLRRINCVDNPF